MTRAENSTAFAVLNHQRKSWRFAQQNLGLLGLSSPIINALWHRGVCTAEDLSKLSIGDAQAIYGIGPKSLERLRGYLSQR